MGRGVYSHSKGDKSHLEILRIFVVGVSNNRGSPKWMVKIMENPIKMDDLGVFPPIFGNIHVDIATFPNTCLIKVFLNKKLTSLQLTSARPLFKEIPPKKEGPWSLLIIRAVDIYIYR